MTKYGDRNNWSKPADTPITLPNYEYENRIYYCDTCKHNLHKLIDSSGQNISYYCNNCSIEVFPTEQIRSRSRLSTPSGPPDEIATTLLPESTLKRKQKEVKGGLKALSEKGLKVTNYKEGKG